MFGTTTPISRATGNRWLSCIYNQMMKQLYLKGPSVYKTADIEHH
jgi:hypothetical protein